MGQFTERFKVKKKNADINTVTEIQINLNGSNGSDRSTDSFHFYQIISLLSWTDYWTDSVSSDCLHFMLQRQSNDYKETQSSYKETQNDHKKMKNDHGDMKNDDKETQMTKIRCQVTTKRQKTTTNTQISHKETQIDQKETQTTKKRHKNIHTNTKNTCTMTTKRHKKSRTHLFESVALGLGWVGLGWVVHVCRHHVTTRSGREFMNTFHHLYFKAWRVEMRWNGLLHAAITLSRLWTHGSTVCLTNSHLTSLLSTSLFNPPTTAAAWMSFFLKVFLTL